MVDSVSAPKYLSPLDIPRLEKRKPSKRLKQKLAELRTITMTIIPGNSVKGR